MYGTCVGINSGKRNIYDYLIIITIASVIFAGETFGVFTPIRLIGFVFSLYFIPVLIKNVNVLLRQYRNLFIFIALFIFYSLLSVLWIVDMKQYFIDALSAYCYIFDLVLILYCSRYARKPLDSIILAWIIFALLNLSCSFWEITTGNHFSSGSFQAEEMMKSVAGIYTFRVYSAVTYGNYNSLSIVLCLILLFILLYIYQRRSFASQLFAIALILCISFVLFVNTSRGSLVCLLLFMIPLFYVLKRNRKMKYLMLIFLLALIYYLWNEYSDYLLFLIDRKVEARSGASGDPRWILWKGGFDIAENWLFFGSGAGSMIYEYTRANIFIRYAHNLFLQMLIEYGLVITTFFAVSCILLIYETLRSSDMILKIIGLYLLICWPILTIIDENYMKPIHWIFFASIYSIYYNRKSIYNGQATFFSPSK